MNGTANNTHPGATEAYPGQADTVPQTMSEFLRLHDGGGTDYDASKALAEVVQAVVDNRAQGTVTLKVTIKPANADCSRVDVQIAVDTKKPKRGSNPAIFFTGDKGRLLRHNPKQMSMRDVVGDNN